VRRLVPAALLATFLLPISLALGEIRHEVRGDLIIATNVPERPKETELPVPAGGAPKAVQTPQVAVPAPPSNLGDLLAGSAARYGFDPGLIQSVVAAESAFDHRAVSRAGARGLMQLMPDTARAYGLKDVQDPASNLEAGVAFLRELVGRFGGDVTLALAAYNAGPEAVARYGGVPPYQETRQYLERIRSYYGDDLQRGDRTNGSSAIRLTNIEDGGVPHYTNIRPRRIPRAVPSSGAKRPR